MDESSAQFNHVKREVRQFVRIAPPIVVVQGGHAFVGQDVSIGGFCVQADKNGQFPEDGLSEIRFVLNGFHVAIVVSARSVWRDAEGSQAGYLITFVEAGQKETFQRLIRTHLSGHRLEIEQAVVSEDEQAPPRRHAIRVETTKNRSLTSIAGYSATGFIAVFLLIAIASSVYGRVMTVSAEFATVTAPAIAVRAPAAGLISDHQLEPGQTVSRDDPLMRIVDSDLDSRIALSDAALEFNSRLAENLEARLNSGDSNGASMISALDPASVDLSSPGRFEQLNRSEARERLEAFRISRDYEQSRVAALRLRQAANTLTAPCACLVRWVLPGGSWVNQGEELLRLADANSSNLLIEAIVPISATERIAPQQQARIYLPNQTAPLSGRVVGIDFDRVGSPRMGFPDWVSHDESIAHVTIVADTPISTAEIGRPVDVVILRNGSVGQALGAAASATSGFVREQWSRIAGLFGEPESPATPSRRQDIFVP